MIYRNGDIFSISGHACAYANILVGNSEFARFFPMFTRFSMVYTVSFFHRFRTHLSALPGDAHAFGNLLVVDSETAQPQNLSVVGDLLTSYNSKSSIYESPAGDIWYTARDTVDWCI